MDNLVKIGIVGLLGNIVVHAYMVKPADHEDYERRRQEILQPIINEQAEKGFKVSDFTKNFHLKELNEEIERERGKAAMDAFIIGTFVVPSLYSLYLVKF